jgi:hypothetical protein
VQAFVVGKELRYACLWNAGKHGQIWDPNCTEAHFRKTTDELWKWARLSITATRPFWIGLSQ